MVQNQLIPQQRVAYFFLKSKDVFKENDVIAITFFARLTREISHSTEREEYTQVETVWVEIDEVKMEHASEKMRALPNCMQRYAITEEVFRNLYQLSKNCPRELFFVTPYYQESSRENFIT